MFGNNNGFRFAFCYADYGKMLINKLCKAT